MTRRSQAEPLRPRTVLAFLGIGMMLYAALLVGSEALVHARGHANPFFKIATADRQDYDWLILGASHAMPLDFADSEARIEAATGKSVINLAVQGAGPRYNRLVLEQFLDRHTARGLIYAVDSFAFRAPMWNEGRIADAGLLARTPFDPTLAARLWIAAVRDGVSPAAALDFSLGFSKINNRERFERDAWDGESQFERRYRRSGQAEDDRIAYLYPQGSEDPAVLARYLDAFDRLIAAALAAGMEVRVVKMPVPASFHAKLPGEADFDSALAAMLARRGLEIADHSLLLDGAEYYFDSDHLGRRGVEAYIGQRLAALMRD